MEQKKRLESIDIAKGIGILLVILGHINTNGQYSRSLIFAFHMPLFFMLSGVFALGRNGFSKSLLKNVKTIYIPFAVMVTCDFIWNFTVTAIHGGSLADSVKRYAKILVGFDMTFYNRALWFLFALFVIKASFLLIDFIKKTALKNTVIAVLTAGAFAFVLLRKRLDVPQDNMYLIAIPGFAFFSIGYFLREQIKSLEETVKRTKAHLVLLVFALAALCVGAYFNGMVDMTRYNYSNPVIYIAAALAGCYAMAVICAYLANSKLVKTKSVLLFYGENSISVLITHYLLTRKLYPIIYERLGITELLYHPLSELLLFVLTALLMIPVILIFNRYLYFVIGRKRTGAD